MGFSDRSTSFPNLKSGSVSDVAMENDYTMRQAANKESAS